MGRRPPTRLRSGAEAVESPAAPEGRSMLAPSEVQMVPRLPDALSAPQSTLIYHQPMAHPAERARAFRNALGLASLALFPTLRSGDPGGGGGSSDGIGSNGDWAGRCRR